MILFLINLVSLHYLTIFTKTFNPPRARPCVLKKKHNVIHYKDTLHTVDVGYKYLAGNLYVEYNCH